MAFGEPTISSSYNIRGYLCLKENWTYYFAGRWAKIDPQVVLAVVAGGAYRFETETRTYKSKLTAFCQFRVGFLVVLCRIVGVSKNSQFLQKSTRNVRFSHHNGTFLLFFKKNTTFTSSVKFKPPNVLLGLLCKRHIMLFWLRFKVESGF